MVWMVSEDRTYREDALQTYVLEYSLYPESFTVSLSFGVTSDRIIGNLRQMLGIVRVRSAPQALFRTVKLARSVTCWKCGTEVSPPEVTPEYFCSSNPCGVVQSVKLKDVNAFQLFNLDQKYLIDLGQLESAYKGIQKQLHPDMFATKPEAERDASLQTSTTINQAYQVTLPLFQIYPLY
jgi:hypothetical protein